MPEGGGDLVFRSCVLILKRNWYLQVSKHFSSSMGVDDFIARLEIALFAYGFTGDNSIGTNALIASLVILHSATFCGVTPFSLNYNQLKYLLDCIMIQGCPRCWSVQQLVSNWLVSSEASQCGVWSPQFMERHSIEYQSAKTHHTFLKSLLSGFYCTTP